MTKIIYINSIAKIYWILVYQESYKEENSGRNMRFTAFAKDPSEQKRTGIFLDCALQKAGILSG